MSPSLLRILVIEDNPGDVHLVEVLLEEGLQGPLHLEQAASLDAGLRRLASSQFDVILLDLTLPDSSGLATFRQVHAQGNGVPIVVLSGADSEEDALEAVRLGAQDYLVKGRIDSYHLARGLRFAIERAAQRQSRAELNRAEQHQQATERLERLTPRERDVLEQLAEGKSLKQIALALGTSYYTVKNQRASLREKLEAESDAELVRLALLARFGSSHSPEEANRNEVNEA